MKELEDLIEVSRFYGGNKDYVIAGGGNTSYKDKGRIWIKASGTSLATITEKDLAILNRDGLDIISEKKYSLDPVEREEEVKQDLAAATITKEKRPSVETSIHNVIEYPFVVHTHPILVNGLMCSKNAFAELKRLFGDEALYIPYTDPGYTLFKKIKTALSVYKKKFGFQPKVIWLQNHGVFVAGNTIIEIKKEYSNIERILKQALQSTYSPQQKSFPCNEVLLEKVSKVLKLRYTEPLACRNSVIFKKIFELPDSIKSVSKPFIPDQIVYCGSEYLFVEENTRSLEDTISKALDQYAKKRNSLPKVILVKDIGLITSGETISACNIIADVFEDAVKIAMIARSFGGPHPMSQKQIDFIENWEVENYRRKVAAAFKN